MKFPFGIDNVVLYDSTDDFLRIHNLTKEIQRLIIAREFVKKEKEKANYTRESLRDALFDYYTYYAEKYPEVIFFKLKKAIIYFQYGDSKNGLKFLEIAHKEASSHFLPKLYLAFEHIQIPSVTKVYTALGILDRDHEITSIHDIFPEVKRIMKSDYLKFLFVVGAIYNERAGYYHNLNIKNKKDKSIEKVYEVASTMAFIDNTNTLTIQYHQFLKTNSNYK